jgi:manganese-transporting P-type ATPase
VCPSFQVFARVAPEQKELILTTFKTVGRVTLMCGDGTNDVGALKQVKKPPHTLSLIYFSIGTYTLYIFLIVTQAHVGMALLNAEPTAQKKEDDTSKDSKSDRGKSKKPKAGESSQPVLPPTANSSVAGPSTSRRMTAADRQREKLKKMLEEMNEEGDGRAAPIVKLGDASMASPFTAKHASVAPTLDIIRQGRSTLVTTLQMFKILGLNCLATAYVLSVMYLDGVKLGDWQVQAKKYLD